MQALADQHLVGGWLPPDAHAIPAEFRTDDYVGAHLLYLVAVHRTDVPAPSTWADLAGPAYHAVAVPDPSVAASALGALGWFAGRPGYGVDFYRRLHDSGAVQVKTPDDVTTGVAQGVYDAGMTTANSAYAAKDDGSPVGRRRGRSPGAVAIYGPIALATAQRRLRGREGLHLLRRRRGGPDRGGRDRLLPDAARRGRPDHSRGRAGRLARLGRGSARTRTTFLAEYQQVFGG